MVILRCLWAFCQGLENTMVISMESTDQIIQLSMFSNSNSFITVGPSWLLINKSNYLRPGNESCVILLSADGCIPVGPPAHAVVAGTVRTSHDHCELGHFGARYRCHHFGAVFSDATCLSLSAHHEPYHKENMTCHFWEHPGGVGHDPFCLNLASRVEVF